MNSPKATLYITFDGLSDPLGQSQILPYLTGIAWSGYHITILSCEKKERIAKEEARIREQLKPYGISWDYIIYNEAGGPLTRFRYITSLSALATKIVKKQDIKLVHCRSYLASLIGLKLKRKYQIPFVFDMRGFWADERIDGNIWSKSNLLHLFFYKYFKAKEKLFIKHADAIVSLTTAALNILAKQFPEDKISEKTSVIPCCTNTSLFKKTDALQLAQQLGISDSDHIIIYTGSIGTWYYTKEMIDCATLWKKKIPALKLLVVTRDTKALSEILKTYPPETQSMIIVASGTYQQMPSFLSLAKASIFFIKPSYSKIASSPTKMAECWAVDLPIITNSGIGDNDFFFNTCKGGILINEFNTDQYQNALTAYLHLLNNKVNYRTIALDHFDTKMAIEKYTSIYNKLT